MDDKIFHAISSVSIFDFPTMILHQLFHFIKVNQPTRLFDIIKLFFSIKYFMQFYVFFYHRHHHHKNEKNSLSSSFSVALDNLQAVSRLNIDVRHQQ